MQRGLVKGCYMLNGQIQSSRPCLASCLDTCLIYTLIWVGYGRPSFYLFIYFLSVWFGFILSLCGIQLLVSAYPGSVYISRAGSWILWAKAHFTEENQEGKIVCLFLRKNQVLLYSVRQFKVSHNFWSEKNKRAALMFFQEILCENFQVRDGALRGNQTVLNHCRAVTLRQKYQIITCGT